MAVDVDREEDGVATVAPDVKAAVLPPELEADDGRGSPPRARRDREDGCAARCQRVGGRLRTLHEAPARPAHEGNDQRDVCDEEDEADRDAWHWKLSLYQIRRPLRETRSTGH